MAPNLRPGIHRIVSLIEGNPAASVNFTRPGLQFVYLNGPVTAWVVRQDGRNTYRLSVGGYPFTGVIDDKVAASIIPDQNVAWIATYREYQDAYTIAPANDEIKGWSVPRDDEANAAIEIRPIISTRSLPPHFLPTQLFRFEPADE